MYLSVAINNNCIVLKKQSSTIFNSLKCIDFYLMAQKMFYLSECSKSFMKFVCLLLFVGGIYTCQPGQLLCNVNCMSTCSMDFRERSINMANFNCGFFFLLFSSIRFCFVHFEDLWRLLCLFPQYTVLVLVIFLVLKSIFFLILIQPPQICLIFTYYIFPYYCI